MKRLLLVVLTVVSVLTIQQISAQVYFGLTPIVQTNRLFLVVEGPTGLSYSIQRSTNGSDWSGATVFPTIYGGKQAFLQSDLTAYGYYRAAAYSNSVFYTSTNSPLIYSLRALVVAGNCHINVYGPTNRAYTVESSTNLITWSSQFIGLSGQTNFIDPALLQRFYRAKTQ